MMFQLFLFLTKFCERWCDTTSCVWQRASKYPGSKVRTPKSATAADSISVVGSHAATCSSEELQRVAAMILAEWSKFGSRLRYKLAYSSQESSCKCLCDSCMLWGGCGFEACVHPEHAGRMMNDLKTYGGFVSKDDGQRPWLRCRPRNVHPPVRLMNSSWSAVQNPKTWLQLGSCTVKFPSILENQAGFWET